MVLEEGEEKAVEEEAAGGEGFAVVEAREDLVPERRLPRVSVLNAV